MTRTFFRAYSIASCLVSIKRAPFDGGVEIEIREIFDQGDFEEAMKSGS